VISHRSLPLQVALLLLLVRPLAPAAGWPGGASDLEAGIATVDRREQRRVWLRLDPNLDIYQAQLEGQTLIIRRETRKVSVPQSWRPLAQHWEQNAAARVLSLQESRGALVAEILWENERMRVEAGDRAAPAPIPPEAQRPIILGVVGHGPSGPTPTPIVSPGQLLWIDADILSPTRRFVECQWTADNGHFVYAGGHDAGTSIKGPSAVRWVAPIDAAGKPVRVPIVLKATSPDSANVAEHTITVIVRPAKGAYAFSQTLPLHTRDSKGRLQPLLSQATFVAGGALDTLTVLDSPRQQLLTWHAGLRRAMPIGAIAPIALGVSGSTPYLVTADALLEAPPDAKAPVRAAAVTARRLVGIGFNAAGDACLFDSGAPPQLHVVGADGAHSTPVGPGVDSPWLTRYGLDPRTSDVYLLNGRDHAVEVWRTLDGKSYRSHGVPIRLAPYLNPHGEAIGVFPRSDANYARELPLRVAFATGAVTQSWVREGDAWQASVGRASAELRREKFAAATACALPSRDIVLAGTATQNGQTVPRIAQVSPKGELRRTLPLPASPLLSIAALPDGSRYLLVADADTSKPKNAVLRIGPEGWVASGATAAIRAQPITRVRADRRSSQYLLLLGFTRGTPRAFRLDLKDPTKCLELGPAGLIGQKVPSHTAIDVASSPQHLAVLTDDGDVILCSNASMPRYLTNFDSDLSEPQAVALFSGITPASAPSSGARSYVCVLETRRRSPCVAVWEIVTAGAKTVAKPIGRFPDPERFPPDVQLSSPLGMQASQPDAPTTLYVLDRSGAQVRAFDVAEIAHRLASSGVPRIEKAPVLDGLPARKAGVDLAVGPSGILHIADRDAGAVHSYERQP